MATYIRDLIDLPERVYRGDFVLRLTEGVTRPEETLRDYVVTPQPATCFDQALAFIRSALDSRSSKAVYLHGSFGSGKSHFMAVPHLPLAVEVLEARLTDSRGDPVCARRANLRRPLERCIVMESTVRNVGVRRSRCGPGARWSSIRPS